MDASKYITVMTSMRRMFTRSQSPRYCRVVLVNVGTSLHVEVTYSTSTLRQDGNVGVPGSAPESAPAGTPIMEPYGCDHTVCVQNTSVSTVLPDVASRTTSVPSAAAALS